MGLFATYLVNRDDCRIRLSLVGATVAGLEALELIVCIAHTRCHKRCGTCCDAGSAEECKQHRSNEHRHLDVKGLRTYRRDKLEGTLLRNEGNELRLGRNME